MNIKPVLAVIAGAVVAFLLMALIYGVLLKDFFATYFIHYTGLVRSDPSHIWVGVATILWVSAIAFVISRSAGTKNFMGGMVTGAILAFFVYGSCDANFYALYNLYAKRALVADVAINTLIGGLTGGVVGLIIGWGENK